MENRALLVGINSYPFSPLNGCVNDVEDMRDLLLHSYGFTDADIRVLADHNATRKNLFDGLTWLIEAAFTGSRLLFHYSGHGTEMKTDDNIIEDAICPVDFDFSPQHSLTARDFSAIFSNIPQGVEFNWLSDSCYSGNLTRLLLKPGTSAKSYPMTAQAMHDLRQIAQSGEAKIYRFQTSSPLNGGFVSGCAADELSSDATFSVNGKDRPNGAFTYFFLQELRKQPSASLINMTQNLVQDLRRESFTQTPQVKGATSVISQAFLGGMDRGLVVSRASRLFDTILMT